MIAIVLALLGFRVCAVCRPIGTPHVPRGPWHMVGLFFLAASCSKACSGGAPSFTL